MARVFVVNMPMKKDAETGGFTRAIDVTPAAEHGELVFLLPSGQEVPPDPAVVVDLLWEKLGDYRDEDFILPVGHPAFIGWATAIAACANDGRVNLLHWQRRTGRYQVMRAALWKDGEAETSDDAA